MSVLALMVVSMDVLMRMEHLAAFVIQGFLWILMGELALVS